MPTQEAYSGPLTCQTIPVQAPPSNYYYDLTGSFVLEFGSSIRGIRKDFNASDGFYDYYDFLMVESYGYKNGTTYYNGTLYNTSSSYYYYGYSYNMKIDFAQMIYSQNGGNSLHVTSLRVSYYGIANGLEAVEICTPKENQVVVAALPPPPKVFQYNLTNSALCRNISKSIYNYKDYGNYVSVSTSGFDLKKGMRINAGYSDNNVSFYSVYMYSLQTEQICNYKGCRNASSSEFIAASAVVDNLRNLSFDSLFSNYTGSIPITTVYIYGSSKSVLNVQGLQVCEKAPAESTEVPTNATHTMPYKDQVVVAGSSMATYTMASKDQLVVEGSSMATYTMASKVKNDYVFDIYINSTKYSVPSSLVSELSSASTMGYYWLTVLLMQLL